MFWLYTMLLVLSPAILYGFALLVYALVMKHYRRLCSACMRRGLKCVNCILATVIVNGKPAPDSWTYYICENCGAGFMLHCGEWSRTSRDEIHQFEAPGEMNHKEGR